MNKHKVSRFSVTDYLDSDDMITEYLNAALERSDSDLLEAANVDIARARDITEKPPLNPAVAGAT